MILKQNNEALKALHVIHTVQEIKQQPLTWRKTIDLITAQKDALQAFLRPVLEAVDYDIILSGAGTSEFVGNSIYSYLNETLQYRVKSYATTDIVATPNQYLSRTKKTLLISFGRSGNSPESIGAVDAANAVCEDIRHLFITCNKNGALSKAAELAANCYAIHLADETHDQGFAMTSSFTNMMLACLLTFRLDMLPTLQTQLDCMIKNGEQILNEHAFAVEAMVQAYDFSRIVYLGSNSCKGIAQESALKMLELTAGQVVTMHDTPLGFRHGPKSIINDETLTVLFVSDAPYTRQYEKDLLKEMSSQRKGNKIMVVMHESCAEMIAMADYVVDLKGACELDNAWLGFAHVLTAQLIAVMKSLKLAITPDNPCPSGEVNRVVQGVTLYPYK